MMKIARSTIVAASFIAACGGRVSGPNDAPDAEPSASTPHGARDAGPSRMGAPPATEMGGRPARRDASVNASADAGARSTKDAGTLDTPPLRPPPDAAPQRPPLPDAAHLIDAGRRGICTAAPSDPCRRCLGAALSGACASGLGDLQVACPASTDCAMEYCFCNEPVQVQGSCTPDMCTCASTCTPTHDAQSCGKMWNSLFGCLDDVCGKICR